MSLPTGEREFKCLGMENIMCLTGSLPTGEREFKFWETGTQCSSAQVAPHRGA